MIRVTRHGWIEMTVGTLVLAGLAALLAWAWWPAALLLAPVWIWLIAFFRDPQRPLPEGECLWVSPADGVVSDITPLPDCPELSGPAVRIGIFLSVFNVHVNRAPCAARVLNITYKKGKFINAMRHDDASANNESNTLLLGDPVTGQPIAQVRQIVGLIARRIVCTPAEGQILARGQRIGMIKFGSRTELYIPQRLNPRVRVRVGQTVRGAADAIAEVDSPASSA